MAEFFVRNSLGYNVTVKFNITLRYIVPKDEEGDHKWVLEIGTTYPDINGDPISSRKIHNVSLSNLDQIIEDNVAVLCAQIDWEPLVADKEAPQITSLIPVSGETDVSIVSDIQFTIADLLPSAGIDLSDMKVFLNNSTTDFDITSEVVVEGDPYEYEFIWTPPMRVYDTYD